MLAICVSVKVTRLSERVGSATNNSVETSLIPVLALNWSFESFTVQVAVNIKREATAKL